MLRLHRDPISIRATAEESSKLLKATLRKAFPAVKFSVRLARGTAYGYCSVSWTDGPTRDRVDTIVAPFEGSTFDGMTDMENHHESMMPNGQLTGLRGINCERTISATLARRAAAAVAAYWGGDDMSAPAIVEQSGYWTCAENMTEKNAAARARTGRDWNELIHRAANDRMTVTQGFQSW